MISDVLSDAVVAIDGYLKHEGTRDAYAAYAIRDEIYAVRDAMEALRIRLDMPPGWPEVKTRLEILRARTESERISYGEIAELQDLAEHIDPDDVQLLEWAGVPEDLEERAAFFADRAKEVTRG